MIPEDIAKAEPQLLRHQNFPASKRCDQGKISRCVWTETQHSCQVYPSDLDPLTWTSLHLTEKCFTWTWKTRVVRALEKSVFLYWFFLDNVSKLENSLGKKKMKKLKISVSRWPPSISRWQHFKIFTTITSGDFPHRKTRFFGPLNVFSVFRKTTFFLR